MSKPVDASTRPNHGEHTETVAGSRTRANPGGVQVVRRPPDQVAEVKPGSGQVTVDGKLTQADIVRRAGGR
jgi:hypothetical protein